MKFNFSLKIDKEVMKAILSVITLLGWSLSK
ncbi:hypothetical protein M947_02625 [Sulfurimonas hongkongensis]|uniref:Uncharacterized protein n=1 Tax=Sulfurimonas hongkongensis TaxID=1172190 RepID=T0KTF1_9BACT|nr:hypothetical protein M947_02625 [Sulfurimonas hongkongensis]